MFKNHYLTIKTDIINPMIGNNTDGKNNIKLKNLINKNRLNIIPNTDTAIFNHSFTIKTN